MYVYSLSSLILGRKMRGKELVGREILNPLKPQLNMPPPPPVQGPASLTALPVYRTNSRRAV